MPGVTKQPVPEHGDLVPAAQLVIRKAQCDRDAVRANVGLHTYIALEMWATRPRLLSTYQTRKDPTGYSHRRNSHSKNM